MRESVRTVILFVLLGLAIGFIFWIRHQGEETLQGIDQPEQADSVQLESVNQAVEENAIERQLD